MYVTFLLCVFNCSFSFVQLSSFRVFSCSSTCVQIFVFVFIWLSFVRVFLFRLSSFRMFTWSFSFNSFIFSCVQLLISVYILIFFFLVCVVIVFLCVYLSIGFTCSYSWLLPFLFVCSPIPFRVSRWSLSVYSVAQSLAVELTPNYDVHSLLTFQLRLWHFSIENIVKVCQFTTYSITFALYLLCSFCCVCIDLTRIYLCSKHTEKETDTHMHIHTRTRANTNIQTQRYTHKHTH